MGGKDVRTVRLRLANLHFLRCEPALFLRLVDARLQVLACEITRMRFWSTVNSFFRVSLSQRLLFAFLRWSRRFNPRHRLMSCSSVKYQLGSHIPSALCLAICSSVFFSAAANRLASDTCPPVKNSETWNDWCRYFRYK